jgi:hypothetical protein
VHVFEGTTEEVGAWSGAVGYVSGRGRDERSEMGRGETGMDEGDPYASHPWRDDQDEVQINTNANKQSLHP